MTFHPGHDAWHGFTVAVFTSDGRLVVGRWDAEENGVVRLLDASEHQDSPAASPTRQEFLNGLMTVGPKPTHRMLTVRRKDVVIVQQLGEFIRAMREP